MQLRQQSSVLQCPQQCLQPPKHCGPVVKHISLHASCSVRLYACSSLCNAPPSACVNLRCFIAKLPSSCKLPEHPHLQVCIFTTVSKTCYLVCCAVLWHALCTWPTNNRVWLSMDTSLPHCSMSRTHTGRCTTTARLRLNPTNTSGSTIIP